MMKILMAQGMSYFGLGGASKANRGLLQALAAAGHSCTVISTENRRDLATRGFRYNAETRVAELERDGIKVFSALTNWDQSALLTKCIRELKPDWTLVSEQGILLLQTALETDPSRVILIAHSIIANLPTADDHMRTVLRSILSQTAGIITVSNYMKSYIRQWSGSDSTVIHFPSYGSGPFPRFNNFEKGYVTMINPCGYKGISIFSALARNLPAIPFAAVPTWGTKPRDRAALAQLPNVKLLDPSPNIDDIFAHTKVLLVPSLWGEAFGQIAVEAMLRGIPVLASNAGGLPEAKLGIDYVLPVNSIEHYELDTEKRVQPVVPEQDPAPWIEALQRTVVDRGFYEQLATDSRNAATSFVASLGACAFEQYFVQLASALDAKGATLPESAEKAPYQVA
jgi:glycosyltransferase involved in cell wall biosynthesis